MNNIDNIASTMHLTNELDLQCPYVDATHLCNASFSLLLSSSNMRPNLCNSEDYDNCPIFLAKVLRRRGK